MLQNIGNALLNPTVVGESTEISYFFHNAINEIYDHAFFYNSQFIVLYFQK